MNCIHLLTPSIVPGDAVSNDVLGMRRRLIRRGYRVRVYARTCHEDLRKLVRPLKAYRHHLENEAEFLIYHHSVGWPAGLELYEKSRGRKIVRYHNVTPAIFYEPYNALYVKACRRGAAETRRLAQSNPELFLADSEFNARELVSLGANPGRCRTVPPFHNIGRLDRLPLDDALSTKLKQRRNLLFVGRISPNKGQLHLIRALAEYHHRLRGEAHLNFVGVFDSGLNDYNEELRSEIRRLRLHRQIHFAGKISDRELKTYYAHSSIFLCASEHEGFCVPIVEAMYYGIPIVAYGGTAVGLTLGDSGIVWQAPSPALFAESIRYIEQRPDVAAELVHSQRARFDAQFSMAAIERRFEEALVPLLPIKQLESCSI